MLEHMRLRVTDFGRTEALHGAVLRPLGEIEAVCHLTE
jgi:hypothetical protein